MMIKGEIHSALDESTCSKWVEQSGRQAAISDNCQEAFKRTGKLTMKELLHKKKTLTEREEEKSIAD